MSDVKVGHSEDVRQKDLFMIPSLLGLIAVLRSLSVIAMYQAGLYIS